MKNNCKLLTAFTLLGLSSGVWANQQPSANSNPAYGESNVQAQLRLDIAQDVEVVHFVRDTNAPKILTKTYVLQNADPYEIRSYLREMVQSLKVDYNNAEGRGNTAYYNHYNKDNSAGTQKIFVPTGVECVKYADGTGILIVSAEDYRFADHDGESGIDSMVKMLDVPQIKNSSGQPKFVYFPANGSAKRLLTLIKQVGANVSGDTAELIGGKDKVNCDEELNCLFFNTALYSKKNIESMLKLYDVVSPEIRVSCTVYELDAENDGVIGMDFAAWKSSEGASLVTGGAVMSRNTNVAGITATVTPSGTVNAPHYFNVNASWNSKFFDFLVTRGHARILSTGELTVQNGVEGKITRKSGALIPVITAQAATPAAPDPGVSVQMKPANDKFKFVLTVTPEIAAKNSVLNLAVNTVSLLGYTSDGSTRSSDFKLSQRVMLDNQLTRFYLGGIEKTRVVETTSGVPILKDLPLIGRLFSTKGESVKKSQLIVVADCEVIDPTTPLDPEDEEQIDRIVKLGKTGENRQN